MDLQTPVDAFEQKEKVLSFCFWPITFFSLNNPTKQTSAVLSTQTHRAYSESQHLFSLLNEYCDNSQKFFQSLVPCHVSPKVTRRWAYGPALASYGSLLCQAQTITSPGQQSWNSIFGDGLLFTIEWSWKYWRRERFPSACFSRSCWVTCFTICLFLFQAQTTTSLG